MATKSRSSSAKVATYRCFNQQADQTNPTTAVSAERTLVQSAANGGFEPTLPVFCDAANVCSPVGAGAGQNSNIK